MRFCPECNNMLYPKEDRLNKVLLYACRNCEFKEESDDPCIYRNVIKHTEHEKTTVIYDISEDPTLPRVHVRCERCDNREAVFFQAQTTDENEGMTVFFVCTNRSCRHRWKE